MKKECTEEEARLKTEAYCSLAERCTEEVSRKLEQWGAPATSYETIIEHLKKERYIDEQRYARTFVRDKYRFNQWGRKKIAQALRMKHIASDEISCALEEIDEEEYGSILTSLLRKKYQSVKANSEFERTGKVIRFAASHGYGMEEIFRCLEQIGYGDEFVD